MSNLRTIARLAALVGLVLGLSACHYYAPYYGPPGQHGYYGGHGGHRHHGDRHRDNNRRPYRPYGY